MVKVVVGQNVQYAARDGVRACGDRHCEFQSVQFATPLEMCNRLRTTDFDQCHISLTLEVVSRPVAGLAASHVGIEWRKI
jgi:hypothetical protein